MNVVAGVIYSDDGKVLIAQKKSNSDLSGKWEFPGGKIEKGEKAIDALKREFYEEFVLHIDVFKELLKWDYSYENYPKINFIAFSGIIVSGTLKLNIHSDIKWVDIKELYGYDLLAADMILVDFLNGGNTK